MGRMKSKELGGVFVIVGKDGDFTSTTHLDLAERELAFLSLGVDQRSVSRKSDCGLLSARQRKHFEFVVMVSRFRSP